MTIETQGSNTGTSPSPDTETADATADALELLGGQEGVASPPTSDEGEAETRRRLDEGPTGDQPSDADGDSDEGQGEQDGESASSEPEAQKPEALQQAKDLLGGSDEEPEGEAQEQEPEGEAKAEPDDDEWRKQLKGHTRKRFDDLLSEKQRLESELEILAPLREQYGDQQGREILQKSIERHADLHRQGLKQDEIDFGHDLMTVLQKDPKGRGYELLQEYVRAHEEAHGIRTQEAAADASFEGDLPEDLTDLVEAQLLEESDARALAAIRQRGDAAPAGGQQQAQAANQGGQAEQQATQQATQQAEQPSPQADETHALLTGYLADQGVDAVKMGQLWSEHLEGHMVDLMRQDGIRPEALTPRLQLRYAKEAVAALGDEVVGQYRAAMPQTAERRERQPDNSATHRRPPVGAQPINNQAEADRMQTDAIDFLGG